MSLTNTNYLDLENSQMVAMGASRFKDREPLPAVPLELKATTQHIDAGNIFLNETFTFENLKDQRQQQDVEIIHLATHADFDYASDDIWVGDKSYIKLWDRTLRLDEMQEFNWGEDPQVELLVLSACRTALGDPYAEMGFAGLAVRAGVKSALASLWKADDVGTAALMNGFYSYLEDAGIKAAALRQIQIDMIHSKTYVKDGNLYWSGGSIPLPPELSTISKDFSHPYYWSGFTMIGSPF